eukprot:4731037-Alexandrium_andersonii.AAC.1
MAAHLAVQTVERTDKNLVDYWAGHWEHQRVGLMADQKAGPKDMMKVVHLVGYLAEHWVDP